MPRDFMTAAAIQGVPIGAKFDIHALKLANGTWHFTERKLYEYDPAKPAQGAKGWHRFFRRPGYLRRLLLDAPPRRHSVRYTANLGQPDESDYDDIPRRRAAIRSRRRPPDRLPQALVREGLVALQCGAFHISTAGRPYFNTTPIGRAVTGTMLVGAMKQDGVTSGATAHLQGQRHRALLPLRAARQPDLRIYKPWLDAQFIVNWAGARKCRRYERADFEFKTSTEKAYSTDSNLLGRDARGQGAGVPGQGLRIVHPIMGTALGCGGARSTPKRSRSASRGPSGHAERPALRRPVELVLEANAIGGRHGLGISDQIENRIIEAKSRGIYEGPGWRCSYRLRAADLGHPQRGHDRQYRTSAAPRPPAV